MPPLSTPSGVRLRRALIGGTAAVLIAATGLAGSALIAPGNALVAPQGATEPSRHLLADAEPIALTRTATPREAPDSSQSITVRLLLPWKAEGDLANGEANRADLTAAEFDERYGSDLSDHPDVARWLADHGLRPAADSQLGTVAVTGSVADFETALDTEFASFATGESDSNGDGDSTSSSDADAVLAPTRTPSVPAELADSIVSISGLVRGSLYAPALESADDPAAGESAGTHTEPQPAPTPAPPASASRAQPQATAPSTSCARYWGEAVSDQWPSSVKASAKSNWLCGYTPADLRAMHGIPDDYSGEGARIGIIAAYDDPEVEANTNTYSRQVGEPELREGQYIRHSPEAPNESICGGSAEWSIEQHLDVQAAHAIAPDATIEYWGTNDCLSTSLFGAMYDAVSAGDIDVLSLSFGSREETDTAADRALLNRALVQAAFTGVSVFSASGNDGDYSDEGDHAEIDVTSPASSPYITAVGGLSVGMRRDGSLPVVAGWATKPHFARNGGVIPPGFDSGSGGGASQSFTRPSWQASYLGDVEDYGQGDTRLMPDVSSLGDPTSGFTVYAKGKYSSVGGTSLATPVVASMVAISKARSGKTIGLATPWLYRLQGTAAIRDVVPTSAAVWSSKPVSSGQTWPETVYAWDASPQSLTTAVGWDPVSGIGMPTGTAFLDGFGH